MSKALGTKTEQERSGPDPKEYFTKPLKKYPAYLALGETEVK